MKFGPIFLVKQVKIKEKKSMRFSIGISSRYGLDETLDTVEMLDKSGVHAILFEDEATYLNVYALLAIAARATEKVLIGTGVTNPLTRHPVITASSIATVDQLSSGRALLGLGAGGTASMVALGVDVERPVSRLKDALFILRKLLNGEKLTLSEGPYRMHDISLGVLPRHQVPVYIAGRGPRILEMGGLLADGVIAGAGLFSPAAMEYAFKQVYSGAELGNRDPTDIDVIAWAYTSVAEDREKAIEAVARLTYLTLRSAPLEVWKGTGLDLSYAEKVKTEPMQDISQVPPSVPASILNQFALVGTPLECKKQIEEMIEAGVSHLGLLVFPVKGLGLKKTAKLLVNSVLKNFINR